MDYFASGTKIILTGSNYEKEIADKWIKALNSGEYKQGFGQLRDRDDNFCALGVLCNLHAKEHPEIANKQKFKQRYLKQKYVLPEEV